MINYMKMEIKFSLKFELFIDDQTQYKKVDERKTENLSILSSSLVSSRHCHSMKVGHHTIQLDCCM